MQHASTSARTSSLARPYSIRFPSLNCIVTFGIDDSLSLYVEPSIGAVTPSLDTCISFFSIVPHTLGRLGCIVIHIE